MQKPIVALLVLATGAAPLAAQKIENLRKLEFMAGCWQAQTGKDQTVQELWSQPNDSLILGFTQYFTKEKPTNFDFNHIRRTDSTVYLILSPHGQPADTFRIKTLADEVASWERGGTKFPGLVMYRKASDGSLIARLEAPPTLDQPSVEVRFEKTKCPGQK
ncbi:MAG TPA: DUF6265 family protein [Gemmatimonadales bacterium]|jgi:hypothetical protein